MSAAGWRICTYLHDGTRHSTLHAQATEPQSEMIQLATWLAHAIIGTAVLEVGGDASRPVHVAHHPTATRPPDTIAPTEHRQRRHTIHSEALTEAVAC